MEKLFHYARHEFNFFNFFNASLIFGISMDEL